ncbi:DUF5336 domain-containing protein [Mycobacterium sp. 1423905.2]|uniref:DUF5336 domain-containing protein n=1 Tax=Mycobacterium sp. 1423905.2 TaxID=1856859 RepID=UPI0007FBE85A|nr:DUF5336 domain-containing protein [Mycobacterium sp. 1423905.2]OBJ52936.1 hypothetical protein A9W95_19355 [Mycobacterium sp. 1423905.2]
MSYPSSFPGSLPAEQPSGYGSYSQWSSDAEDHSRLSHRHLTLAVVLLGVCSYLISFGPMLNVPGLAWPVRFAVLASLIAALALWAKQTPAGVVVAALAALGFLDALASLITAPEGIRPGWALWVVVVLNGLQALIAAGALRAQPSIVDEQKAWYAAYAEQYAQAAAHYYGQYNEAAPESEYQNAQADAPQVGHATAPEPRRTAATQEASYAEFVAGQESAHPLGHASQPPSAPPAGLPNVGQSAVPAPQQTAAGQPEYRPSS